MHKGLHRFYLVLILCNTLLVLTARSSDVDRISPALRLDLSAVHQSADMTSAFSGLVSSIPADISSANPASISTYQRLLCGMSFEYRTPIEYASQIQRGADHYWLPASAAIVWPLSQGYLGLTYRHGYSEFTDFGKRELSSLEMPDGTGEIVDPFQTGNLHSVGIILAKAREGVFSDRDRLALALQPTMHYLKLHSEFGNTQFTFTDTNIGLRIGLIYHPMPQLGFGVTYRTGPRFKTRPTTELQSQDNSASNPNAYAGFADRLALGAEAGSGHLKLNVSAAYLWYDKAYSNYSRTWQYALKIFWQPWMHSGFGLSYFTENTQLAHYNNSDKQTNWLSLAARYRMPLSELVLEVMDSHLGSSEYLQQTILRFSVNLPIGRPFSTPPGGGH